MSQIEIGRLLRAGTTGCVVGCRVSQVDVPSFGALVRVPLESSYEIFGLIYDIHIDDDGLVRQLVTAGGVDEAIIADNRENRNVPLEMSVLSVGYKQDERLSHMLPPRPPLSLDVIYLCNQEELCKFTGAGNFSYFRHILHAVDIPVGEVLAAHLAQAQAAHATKGKADWIEAATQELIVLLRDDYKLLMDVLSALQEIY